MGCAMSALDFVNSLLETGRVKVPTPSGKSPDDLTPAVARLDSAARAATALELPGVVISVGEWALLLLYRGCQALVYREIEADEVRKAMAAACPARPSPAVCYSADLALQFLPELIGLARGIARDDPLVEGLQSVAAAWPLSSVGVAGLPDGLDVSPFIDHPALRQVYADRIIERADVSRLQHPATEGAVRAALGAFPDLAPRVAAALPAELEKRRVS